MATKRQCGKCPEESDPKRVHKITDFFSTGSHSSQSSSESPLIAVSVSQSSVSDDHDFIIAAASAINAPTCTTVLTASSLPCSSSSICSISSNTSTSSGVTCVVPSDIASSSNMNPVQPIKSSYVSRSFGKSSRSFNQVWFRQFNWLEYSVQEDRAYCFACRFFATGNDKNVVFTKIGFMDWKHALGAKGILTLHDVSKSHKQAMITWQQAKMYAETSVIDMLGHNRKKQIEKNRHYMKTIAKILLLCCRQEIALRGHDEGVASHNRGNFLEILKIVAQHDEDIQSKLLHGPKNATYLSPEMQNLVIHILADMVRSIITKEIKEATYFTILADETKDISKKEQFSIVARYFHAGSCSIRERFLTYIEATSLTADGLSSYILDTIKAFNLDLKYLVSQGYDGASVMSGRCAGVQQKIRDIAPQAIYIHCTAHVLNLVLVDSSKCVSGAAEFFALLQSLYTFMSSSKVHVLFLQWQEEIYPGKRIKELKRLIETRWACKYDAVEAVLNTFEAIIATLEDIMEGSDKEKAVEAKGLFLQVHTFSFLLQLIVFDKVLGCTKALSDILQKPDLDLASASALILSTKSTLQGFRSQETWDHTYQYVLQVAAHLNISPNLPHSRQRRPPKSLKNYVISESTGSRQDISACSIEDGFKVSLFYPVLDTFISQIDQRFSNFNLDIMRSVQACSPQSDNFLHTNTLKPLIELYGFQYNRIEIEATLAKSIISQQGEELTSIADVIKCIISLKSGMPNIVNLLIIAATIAVSSATCERSFSSMKRIKTYLRSTMGQQRLQDVSILSIEDSLSKELSLDDFISNFCSVDKNHRIMLH